MNPDEINALVTKIAAMVFTSWGTAAGINGANEQALAAGLGALAAVVWGIYSHWNMKKVPEGATVVGGGK